MNVVVVESPSKAKTINKYLGANYKVLASYGHVRDLPAKDGSVDPEKDFSMIWQIDEKGAKRIDDIAKALKNADMLYLATDPDREGEAISWHVCEALKNKGQLQKITVKRVVFNQITKGAVLKAMENPRDLNQELVEAYLARRALDYLVGFTLSPILWRKLPGSRSAGRVQSVALRIITEREAEIEAFQTQEYWTVTAEALAKPHPVFKTRLIVLNHQKLEKFSLKSQEDAEAAVTAMRPHSYEVFKVEKKRVKRNPPPPFTTSTLQQEASRKLGFGASRTMQTAQRLYEGIEIDGETVGLITYMRTDSVQVAEDAIAQCRQFIPQQYGDSYLPEAARVYKTKAKNAQEAHEAIRPTDIARTPESLRSVLEDSQYRAYELIWKRMVASQMASADIDQVSMDIASPHQEMVIRATGSTIAFEGFLKLYEEGRDDDKNEDEGRLLPPLKEGDAVILGSIEKNQHFTQPPPRYSEASLVKKLEELGIGRPSTYASILQVLQDRNYVRLEKRVFFPEDRGRIVTSFLTNFFDHYFQYGFTAELETQLDDISDGKLPWKKVLQDFWKAFKAAVDQTKDLTITQVLETLDKELAAYLFPVTEDGKDPRVCPQGEGGILSLKLGKFGAFIGCSQYPECGFTRPLSSENTPDVDLQNDDTGPQILGKDPQTGQDVSLRKGPYGPYVQLGEGSGKVKPRRSALPRGTTVKDFSLDHALSLLALPRELGKTPTAEPVSVGLGRFGPYIKVGTKFVSLGKDEDVLTVELDRALEIIQEAADKPKSTRFKAPPKGKAPVKKAPAGAKKPAASEKKS